MYTAKDEEAFDLNKILANLTLTLTLTLTLIGGIRSQ